MNREEDIKSLYQIMGFLAGLSALLDDLYNEKSVTSSSIEQTRVTLGNIISRMEKGYCDDKRA